MLEPELATWPRRRHAVTDLLSAAGAQIDRIRYDSFG